MSDLLIDQLLFFKSLGVTHLQGMPEDGVTGPENATEGPATLTEVREIIGDCQRCKLASGRRNIVFGVGNPNAELMFVGEAPGADEDRRGEPFVGKAGQLLTRIIETMFDLERKDVYIANILKCRPPGNRDPEPDEVETCEQFLFEQIRLVRPKIIVALGRYAAQTLLRSETAISRLRGKFYDYRGTQLLPTFHPSYLLRNPSAKRDVFNDMKAVRERLR